MRNLLSTAFAFVFALGVFGTSGCVDPEANKASKGVHIAAEGDLTPEEKGKIVARIGDRVITLEQFERRLNQQSPFARARYNSAERKKEFLDSLVRFELLALEAEAKGLDKDPDVQLARKQAMVKRLSATEIRDLVKLSDITEEDVKGYYDEHADEFDKPAQVRASHILFADEAAAAKVLPGLTAAIAKDPKKARAAFEDFARKHSTDKATRDRGGDLQFFGEPGVSRVKRSPIAPPVPPALGKAAFGLAGVGDMHPAPIKTSQGWHLLQKTGFRRPYKRSFSDVRTTIRNKLFRIRKSTAMEDYVKALKAKAKITIDDVVLAQAKVKTGSPGRKMPSLDPPNMKFAPKGLRNLRPGKPR